MLVTREVEIDGKDHDVEIEILEEDVLEFISNCSGWECQNIHDAAIEEGADSEDCDCEDHDLSALETYNECAKEQGYPVMDTLADQMKMELIASVWDNFTLEQLEKKLSGKSNKILQAKRK